MFNNIIKKKKLENISVKLQYIFIKKYIVNSLTALLKLF